ncbi:hybrid sensor histidine kinase/response regulator transcription factor [Dyadobacter crusticola]|uniref:hybrid sensor histidine kinase/response regulator transcription factor n=1 Tax=Dyadobacter crusticola TaxID=292407 RepID=UPI001E4B2600|nr:two-component regulator propeller domain-containing protein [Dyadobacter crusticola]
MRGKILFFFLLLLVQPNKLSAQSTPYRFMKLDATSGLSNNQVTCFLKDSRGYMWFGTISGLNRYDGRNVRVFRNDIRDSSSVQNNHIIKLFEDPQGRIWVTTIEGISIFDPEKESFIRNTIDYVRRFGLPDAAVSNIVKESPGKYWFVHDSTGIYQYRQGRSTRYLHYRRSDNRIAAIGRDHKGDLWVVHRNGVLDQIDGKSHRLLYRNTALRQRNPGQQLPYSITIDRDGDLWIYVLRANSGVHYFNAEKKAFTHIDKNTPGPKLNSNIIQGIVEGNNGLIWIGTDHGGINILDKQKWQISYLVHDIDNKKSLSQNTINSLYKDDSGIIWTGTYKDGINYYHENIFRFPIYEHNRSKAASLPFNDLNRFAEDERGNLWLAANGGGLIYFDRQKNTFKSYLHKSGDANSIGSNVIVSLLIDSQKKLWIGTYYGGLSCFDGKTFKTYRHNPADKNSIADDSIWEIFEDSKGQLWIGTLNGGLDRLDRSTGIFTHYASGAPNSVHASYVSEITEDKAGKIWVGTSYGLERYDYATNRFQHFLSDAESDSALSNNLVHAIFEDDRGLLWIGTHEGLNLYDQEKQNFRTLRKEDGLPDNTILSITQDRRGNLWLGTTNGISKMQVSGAAGKWQFSFINYDESDGLQGKEFTENAALTTRSGQVIFGGSKGFNLFDPESITSSNAMPKVILSELYLFNKKVGIGKESDGSVILEKALNQSSQITFKHHQNVLSIEFSALNFFHPEKNRYRYQLEGFDKEWITAIDKSGRATYTNLDPGTYVFKVTASNNDGVWSPRGAELKIVILPPWWQTWTAVACYILLIAVVLYLSRREILRRERMRFEHQQERKEAQRMHELDQMKINFFTNVSHEFRTPLTLILSPIENMVRETDEPRRQSQLNLIYRNAKRLLNLVNQLLDLGKLEFQELRFNPREGDILRFIRETTFSFSDLSEKKHVKLSFESQVKELITLFDEDKLEKILFNLLSNAFKFTPENGTVKVTTNIIRNQEQLTLLEINVMDTGIGIPAEKQEKIFDRFFQNELPVSMVNQGSGIGLSITREFVRIHGGTITVSSAPDQGSCFTVTLPAPDPREAAPDPKTVPGQDAASASAEQSAELLAERPKILLVEDHADFRHYLKENLSEKYQILEAADGKQGLKNALGELPDLIVSDVMMPEMNGIELCRRLKENAATSHIPVLLLTARNSEEQKLEGYQTGAQDYIEKPFNFEILQSKIKSLLNQQRAARKAYRQQVTIKGKDVAISSLDEKLIQKAIEVVEKNMANPDFSVEAFSKELGMSRIHLYRKLNTLTGQSPVDFIRTIRLDRSRQLLEQSQLTVSEIAYQVGFNNPKYFAKHFREKFGELPSAYAGRKKSSAVPPVL